LGNFVCFFYFHLKALSIFVILNIEYFTQRRYKKRLYTQVLSLSAAVLMAVLAQGKAAADQQNSTESQPAANQIEAVTPATEAAPNQTGEKEQAPAPAADNPAVSAAAQTRAAASEEAKTQLADSTVYMSEPAELKETVQGHDCRLENLEHGQRHLYRPTLCHN